MTFEVNSGRYEDGERNYKYINQFETFEEAYVEWEINRDYAFNEILFLTPGGRWVDVTPRATGE